MNLKMAMMALIASMLIGLAACGGAGEAAAPEPPTPAQSEPEPANEELAMEIATAAAEVERAAAEAEPADTGCEEYFRFCTTSTISGAVDAVAAGGVGANIGPCAEWAAVGEARILELPMMLAAGDAAVTVALTRVGQYAGPGQYELKPVAATGMPDMFPTLEVDGRAFSNGEGSTAIATINADGSGSVEARGLVEIASIQVSEPDPSARIDFSMQWICQDN